MSSALLADWVTDLVRAAGDAGEDIAASLQLVRDYGRHLPQPGQGQTAKRWQILSALGSANLTVARVFEAHTDAIAILAEAGEQAAHCTYGVFAAESSHEQVRAISAGEGFELTGTKPWCSLGAELDSALVTAHVDGGRQLFLVDLRHQSVSAAPTSGWVARGLRTITSTSLTFEATPARPIGDREWYLQRPGFHWGGIGVAACWYGGAVGLQRRLLRGADDRIDQLAALHLGAVDIALHAAGLALAHAAERVDHGDAIDTAGELLALRTRVIVVAAVERTLRETEHALGPGPLAFEEDHARRVADLGLYIRQHHAERDLALLGRTALPDRTS